MTTKGLRCRPCNQETYPTARNAIEPLRVLRSAAKPLPRHGLVGDGHRVTAMMEMRMGMEAMMATTMPTTRRRSVGLISMRESKSRSIMPNYMIGSLAGPRSMASRESLRWEYSTPSALMALWTSGRRARRMPGCQTCGRMAGGQGFPLGNWCVCLPT